MSKEKQIEEMVDDIDAYIESVDVRHWYSDELDEGLAEALYNAGYRKHRELTPCDCCLYSPPSSGDGKPCSICPTQAKMRKEDEGK